VPMHVPMFFSVSHSFSVSTSFSGSASFSLYGGEHNRWYVCACKVAGERCIWGWETGAQISVQNPCLHTY